MRHKLPQKPAIRIAMVEDDQLRLVGLRSLLSPVDDFELIAMSAAEIVSDGSVAVALIGNHTGLKFFDVMASLTMLRPDLRIIVTGFSSDE